MAEKQTSGIGKGTPGPGRPKGVPNKLTTSAKEAFALAFEGLGGYEGMIKWAKSDPDNLKTFYSLYSKLIPVDLTTGGDKLPAVVINVPRVD
jgi:hypothetical protein